MKEDHSMNVASSAARRPKHAVILCHPEEDSFNATVARHYCEKVREIGHEAVLRDLYRIGFDPVLKANEQPGADHAVADDVATELDILGGSDVFVLVYPIWFAMPPAMMKGYVDRVLGAGFSHGAIHDRVNHPLMSGKRMLSFTSSGTSKQWLEEQGAWLSLRNLFDDYLRHAFSLRGAEHVHFPSVVQGMKQRVLNEHLWKVNEAARQMCSSLHENAI
jgi:NAD(P)H dehydrogenase (quinone)